MEQQDTDWKKIALELAQRVNFAVSNLKAPGSGMIGNFSPGASDVSMQHWMDYFAEAMEMIPGVKVDREVMMVNNLPPSKRKKAWAEIKAAREAAAGSNDQVQP